MKFLYYLGKKRSTIPPLEDNPEDKKNEENVKKTKIEETSSNININNYNNINDNNLTKCKRKKIIKHEELLNDIIKKEENILINCEIF